MAKFTSKKPAKAPAKPQGKMKMPPRLVRQPGPSAPSLPPLPMPAQTMPLTMKLQASRAMSPNPTLLDLLGAR